MIQTCGFNVTQEQTSEKEDVPWSNDQRGCVVVVAVVTVVDVIVIASSSSLYGYLYRFNCTVQIILVVNS